VADPIEEWEQQEGEGPEAFGAFARYRDTAPEDRSLRKLADEVGKDPSLMKRWSADHAWQARCLAYDRHVDDLRRARNRKEIEKMNQRHAAQAAGLQGIAIRDMKALQERQKEAEDDELVLTPELLLRYFNDGTRMERLARGEPESLSALDIGAGDPLTRAIVTDEKVRSASRDLIRAAAKAAAPLDDAPAE
jgi:hypothetical protein